MNLVVVRSGHPFRINRLAFGTLIIVAVILLAALGLWAAKREPPRRADSLRLADGTQAYYYSNSKVTPAPGYPRPRELHLDGAFFLRFPDHGPLIIRTRLMILTVTGESVIRVTAYSHEAGEQVEVFTGHVRVEKSYASPYPTPENLSAGELAMLNRTIDLMEKETCRNDIRCASSAAAPGKEWEWLP
jgi:hypothetical protein